MNTFVCQRCNKEFETTANRALYCPECRKIRQIERNKKYRENRMLGLNRCIGQDVVCEECGELFTLQSGSQKVCDNCRTKVTNRKKSIINAKYTAKAYDYHRIYLPKGEKAKLQEIADNQHISLNELINNAIKAYLKNLNQ
jgi:DNA-directed RNA polymerase subunit RPC12/RpoP